MNKQRPVGDLKKKIEQRRTSTAAATPAADVPRIGEGNHQADRDYREAATEFAANADVEQAARDAAPRSASEAAELQRAEAEGREKSKGEDPALHVKGLFPSGGTA